MSSYFQSSSSSGGSPYFGGGSAGAPASGGGGNHGVLGLVKNFGSDIGHSIIGIPEGIVQTFEHPIRTAEQIGHQYAQTYGPLTHGDVSKFLHNVYEHPLGPALDVANVLSLGATGLGRAGLAPLIARSVGLLGERGTAEVEPRSLVVVVGRSSNRTLAARKARGRSRSASPSPCW